MKKATTKKTTGKNLRDLLVQKLQVLYYVENTLAETLPKMEKAATDKELKKGFKEHGKEIKKHQKRLEEIFEILGLKPKAMESAGIRGIAEDADWVIKNVKPKEALDANLARAAQYAEHYEIAGYMSALEWADALGEEEVADILDETLEDELTGEEKLGEVARMLDKKLLESE